MKNGVILSRKRYTVQLHYMWNRVTHQYDQVKFKTTAQQGCEGTEIRTDSGGAGETFAAIGGVVNGFNSSNYGVTAYQRERSGFVETGPIVQIGATFLNWSGVTTFGNGAYGGYGSVGVCTIACTTPPKKTEY